MINSLLQDPGKRQVLINLRNRFVLFGPESGLPEGLRFEPQTSPILPRLADESETIEARVLETLQVAGFKRLEDAPRDGAMSDLVLVDPDGQRLLIDVKIRERDPKQRDFAAGSEILEHARKSGENLEVWFFNTERLKLTIMYMTEARFGFSTLVPLNVWEKTADSLFTRSHVVEEVENWLGRLKELYSTIREWFADQSGFRCEQERMVTMSEEIMQLYAVSDREVPVLDVLREDEVVVSFVPRGLWFIGAWGRVDVITPTHTSTLVAIKDDGGFEWKIVSSTKGAGPIPLDRAALLKLVDNQ